MRRRSRLRISSAGLAFLVVPLVGCGPGDGTGDALVDVRASTSNVEEETTGEETAIASAVALMRPFGEVFCSGSVVAPQVVLTAAHCVVSQGRAEPPFAVSAGSDVSHGGVFARVLSARIPPEYDPFTGRADIALLRLAGPVGGLTPIPLAREVPMVGDAVRFVGFGASEEGPASFRRVGTATVMSRERESFTYEPGTCFGDSGGPVLRSERGPDGEVEVQLGVASQASLLCSRAIAIAVADFEPFLSTTIAELDPPQCRGGDGECGEDCATGDPDCPCVEDDVCALCDGLDPDCSFACPADGVCADRCVAPDPDCRASLDDAPCEADIECASGACFEGQCRQRCGVDPRAGCPPWLDCTPVEDGRSLCLMPPLRSAGCSTSEEPITPRSAALGGLGSALFFLVMTRRRRMRR